MVTLRSQYKEIAKQQAPTHHRIATHARGKEGSCELTKEERIISTPTSNQDAIIVAYIAIVLANHSNRDKITSNHDMVLLEPGLARDAELGTLGLRGDDEAIIVVPEDGRVTLGANIESMKAPGLSTYPVIQIAPSESGCWSSRVGHMDGRRLGEYKSPDGSTMTANGDCITHIKPRCDSGILLNSDCVVGNPSTPDGTDHRDQNCVSRELPKCTEEGYEWSELENNAARREKLSASTDTVRRTASVSQAMFLTVERMVPWKEKTVSARRNQHALMTHTGMVKIVGHQTSQTVVRVSALRTILFDLSSPKKTVCLIHYHPKNEWLLAKGRRNCGESRHEAALREVREETGYQARLHPVTIYIRAPPMDEQGHMPDEPRCYPDLTEPFMVTIRQFGGDGATGVKIIWWYIAALDEGAVAGSVGKAEEEFTARFFPLEEAVEKLSFRDDWAVLQKAIALVEGH
ncbi:unnamed protein product [Aspergillus oryzae]|nr:unnamed protein product [Aspergillus oryzae]